MSGKFEAPRGTQDVTPADWPVWAHVIATAEALFARYGYRRIQTPVLEDTELFTRTAGEGSDVVQKEMYTFTDRSDRSLTLRPEGTAPICRAYLQHGMQQQPQPVKLYAIASMYRYAAPQRGRYREHWQFSVEAIGTDDPAIDAELIQLYDSLLRSLGIDDHTLFLNSIGDPNCRPQYVEALSRWLDEHDEQLDDDAREKRRTSPLRVFDVKSERVREALASAPRIGESLCDACREHFAAVRSYLDAYGVPYELDSTLVRGLDYYTRTTFEFVPASIGLAVGGGGRYDGLIEQLGGRPTPGIGFGAGIERIVLSLGDDVPPPPALDVFFALDEGAQRELVLGWLKALRDAGVAADTDYAGRSLKGQLTQAGRSGAHTTVIVGAEGATLRRQGAEDQPLSHADVVGTLLR
ncbi:MAG TPA: histidine--tRNA ligase [Gaiellaceae bacterium]|nr:histidine--tRNA ligase [Gaiellaceae bacterium]